MKNCKILMTLPQVIQKFEHAQNVCELEARSDKNTLFERAQFEIEGRTLEWCLDMLNQNLTMEKCDTITTKLK